MFSSRKTLVGVLQYVKSHVNSSIVSHSLSWRKNGHCNMHCPCCSYGNKTIISAIRQLLQTWRAQSFMSSRKFAILVVYKVVKVFKIAEIKSSCYWRMVERVLPPLIEKKHVSWCDYMSSSPEEMTLLARCLPAFPLKSTNIHHLPSEVYEIVRNTISKVSKITEF